MHEVGLLKGILATAEREAAGRQVALVRVRVGVVHRVTPEAMAMAFDGLRAGTALADARLEIDEVPIRSLCRTCGAVAEDVDPVLVCPTCGLADMVFAGGDELTLESIAYRDGAPPASATIDRPASSVASA